MKSLFKIFLFFLVSTQILSCKSEIEKEPVKPVSPNPNQEVVGYLPWYGMGQVNNIDFSKLTQVLYFSLQPNKNGSLNVPANTVSNINRLKSAIGNNEVDIIVSIGGYSLSGNFPDMSETEEKRAKFIEELKGFCIDNGLIGADIDWEFPVGDEERKNCTSLLMEMQSVFKENNLIVTSAQRANSNDLEDEALQYLDQLHIMAYDAGAEHSTYEYAVSCTNHFIKRGMDRSKIVLGVPFYGRKTDEFSNEATYRTIYNTYKPESDINEAGDYYFNGIDMIKSKTQYAIDQGLMGVMIWEISQDTYDESSLLKAIDDTKKANQ